MFTDGSAPQSTLFIETQNWNENRCWLRGLDLFDHRYLWECHERFEDIWRQVPRVQPTGLLAQGIIQSAAFLLKMHMGHQAGAKSLLAAAISKLTEVHKIQGDTFRGVQISRLIDELLDFEQSKQWPVIGISAKY